MVMHLTIMDIFPLIHKTPQLCSKTQIIKLKTAGQIYFGPGGRMHKVSVDSDFTQPRITLGFDIHLNPETPDGTFALLPLL